MLFDVNDDDILGSSPLTEIPDHGPITNSSSFRFENVHHMRRNNQGIRKG